MWEDVFREAGTEVRVDAELQALPPAPDVNLTVTEKLVWSITRL